jgi:hypothetical protein
MFAACGLFDNFTNTVFLGLRDHNLEAVERVKDYG